MSKMDRVSERIRCARMQLLSSMTSDDKRLTVVSARRKKLCRVPVGLMKVICNTTKACSNDIKNGKSVFTSYHRFFFAWSSRLEGMFLSVQK